MNFRAEGWWISSSLGAGGLLSRRDSAQDWLCQLCPFCPMGVSETKGLVLSVCVQTPHCPALPTHPFRLGEGREGRAERRFCSPALPGPTGFVFFSWKRCCRISERCRSQRFGLAGFLLGLCPAPALQHRWKRRCFIPAAFPSPWFCLCRVPNPAGPRLGLGRGRGCASPVWRAGCHQRAPGFFHETAHNFPGSAGGDGIVLPAVTDRAVTEFCAAQLLVLFPPSALNPPGPRNGSKGK